MSLTSEFVPLELDQLRREAAMLKADRWRFVQTHAVNTDDGVDLYYSFMKNGNIVNYRIAGVKPENAVPSITDLFLAAFVFENEARELFGVDMRDIAIDFKGAMYAPAQAAPMTFITPEQKAAREKARKAAAAKAAKDGQVEAEKVAPASSGKKFVLSDEKRAQLEERLATMSPEKVAKVRAALAAREAQADAAPPAKGAESRDQKQAAKSKPAEQASAPAPNPVERPLDQVLEEKIALLDADKAEKVRAAIAAKAAVDAGLPAGAVAADARVANEAPALIEQDEQLAELLGNMDEAKAAKVREALRVKGGE